MLKLSPGNYMVFTRDASVEKEKVCGVVPRYTRFPAAAPRGSYCSATGGGSFLNLTRSSSLLPLQRHSSSLYPGLEERLRRMSREMGFDPYSDTPFGDPALRAEGGSSVIRLIRHHQAHRAVLYERRRTRVALLRGFI